MKNLLDNIHVGTIFLDPHLHIRRYTREATRAYRLVASDVGRPLTDIKSDLAGEDLLSQAQTVLDDLTPREREVQNQTGDWYLARIQPYRTLDNVIDGVVLTFTDISKRVAAEAAMREARELAEALVDSVRDPLLVLSSDLRLVSASRAYYQRFHTSPGESVGRKLYELGGRIWDIPGLRELLETVLPRDQSISGHEIEFTGDDPRRYRLNARRIVTHPDATPLILLTLEEVG